MKFQIMIELQPEDDIDNVESLPEIVSMAHRQVQISITTIDRGSTQQVRARGVLVGSGEIE